MADGTGAITIGIIGTAGRQADGPRLDAARYAKMVEVARCVVAELRGGRPAKLVSGGAAYADHVAVALALEGAVAPEALTLHLPARLAPDGRFEATRDGGASNHYHRLFAAKTGVDPHRQLAAAVAAGATVTVSDGFFARNAKVAGDAGDAVDALIAFTFGDGEAWTPLAHGPSATAAEAGLKDGGTAHTWTRCRARVKIHVRLD